MKEDYKPDIVFADIPDDIKKQLKDIESLATVSLTKAHQQCLARQASYAFTKEEIYFKVYTHIISVMKQHPEYLEAQPKNLTEGNYNVQLWGPIINAVFEHPTLKVMWRESVNSLSLQAKKVASGSQTKRKKYIGDKVDFRVCYKHHNKLFDLLNDEVAKEQNDDKKYYSDHTKLSRGTKIIADHFYSSRYVKAKEKRSLKVRGVQLADVEGEMIEVCLVKNGLYVLSVLGSLRLPTCQDNLHRLRSLIKRLLEIKRGCLALSRTYRKMNEAAKDQKINKAKKRNVERSPESDSNDEDDVAVDAATKNYIDWTRDSWFPPSRHSTKAYDGSVPPFLLLPPTSNEDE